MAGWPHWVYGAGQEPDYRFSFANERTFLAWIRTLTRTPGRRCRPRHDPPHHPPGAAANLARLLAALGLLCALASWIRWARAERAMRRRKPLPAPRLGALVSGALVITALAVLLVGM